MEKKKGDNQVQSPLQVEEGNRLIDAFAPEVTKKMQWGRPKHIVEHEGLQYHSSWDWQIPVWSKVGKLIKQIAIDGDGIQWNQYVRFLDQYENAVFDNNTIVAHDILVKAIQWYNQQTQTHE